MPAGSKIYPDVVPVIGLAGCSVLLLSLPMEVVGTGYIVLLLGAGFRLLRNRIQA